MGSELQFDIDQAKALEKTISAKANEISKALNNIGGLVEESVRANWSGASAQGFVKLFENSRKNAQQYLKDYITNSKNLINQATKAKLAMEEAEKSMLDQADKVRNLG